MTNPNLNAQRDEALRWLYGRINYEAAAPIPYSERGMKLDRMRALLTRLGDPQQRLRIVHIAGTKGKGSTAAMIAAALHAGGQRVGVYSSPHLERFEERIAIDLQPCSAEALVGLVERVRDAAEAMDAEGEGPTFFDLSTAMALLHFADEQVDTVVLEVGLGGRLDSTNVCQPVVTVITSISLDHMEQLGSTRAAIAAEKAGIFKPGVPAVSGVADAEAGEVIERIAKEAGAPLLQRGRDFFIQPSSIEEGAWTWHLEDAGASQPIDQLRPALPGRSQAENCAVAMAVLCLLGELGAGVPVEAQRAGIAAARLPARMERFAGKPVIVLDGAHNEAAAAALVEGLDSLAPDVTEQTLVLAVAKDKDAPALLGPLLPRFDRVCVTRFVENPRAIDPARLAELVAAHPALEAGAKIKQFATPEEALCHAVRETAPSGLVVVAGSFFLAAELRRQIVADRPTG